MAADPAADPSPPGAGAAGGLVPVRLSLRPSPPPSPPGHVTVSTSLDGFSAPLPLLPSPTDPSLFTCIAHLPPGRHLRLRFLVSGRPALSDLLGRAPDGLGGWDNVLWVDPAGISSPSGAGGWVHDRWEDFVVLDRVGALQLDEYEGGVETASDASWEDLGDGEGGEEKGKGGGEAPKGKPIPRPPEKPADPAHLGSSGRTAVFGADRATGYLDDGIAFEGEGGEAPQA
ncbi:hypothetical protein DFJ74DRAFT_713188 [Hyaloraphidium curvatum]|nr:hypothetical protein DFJ74DRAFT_713188 [Hyaloraphidium curvatum]